MQIKNKLSKGENPEADVAAWQAARRITEEDLAAANLVLREVMDGSKVYDAIRRHPVPEKGHISKYALVTEYHNMVAEGEITESPELLAKIRMKPIRTLSGVTTVTVLTKPWPCPGNCIFCPTISGMPKSYLPDEPGAARAFQNHFDPYDQVSSRITAYEAVGHPTEKIELLILGGSWTNYPDDYQEKFIQRCLDAMNGTESHSLEEAQKTNETASHRNVGLVIETRPDLITPDILKHLRILGVTKIQLGIQSLNPDILIANHRGHTISQALDAVKLLRADGFKIVLHWMPNLLNATPESDQEDFKHFWQNSEEGWGFCPDELKIYPTQLLENTGLCDKWKEGVYHPYSTETLIELLADIKPEVPPYCRINRVIRDIPSQHVAAGSTRSSLRQDVKKLMDERGTKCQCIRCREIRGEIIDPSKLVLKDYQYHAASAWEHFLEFITPDDRIAGYLRLSLPDSDAPQTGIEELKQAAMIREIHIYGQSLPVGTEQKGAAQHSGLGTDLIQKASEIASAAGFINLAVISAIGTRTYYEKRGFKRGKYYLIKSL